MGNEFGLVKCPGGQLLDREVSDGVTIGFFCLMCKFIPMRNIQVIESTATQIIIDPIHRDSTIEVIVKKLEYQISCPNAVGYET